jgi:hypothetical protein
VHCDRSRINDARNCIKNSIYDHSISSSILTILISTSPRLYHFVPLLGVAEANERRLREALARKDESERSKSDCELYRDDTGSAWINDMDYKRRTRGY